MYLVTPKGKHHVEMKPVRGEPGDMRWENIYVNPVESCLRSTFFTFLMIVVLVFSLASMIIAQWYILSLPAALDCSIVSNDYELNYQLLVDTFNDDTLPTGLYSFTADSFVTFVDDYNTLYPNNEGATPVNQSTKTVGDAVNYED